MIGNAIKGKGARGLLEYLLNGERATIIGGTLAGNSNAILFGGLVCSMKLVDEYPPDGRMSSRYHTRVGNKSN